MGRGWRSMIMGPDFKIRSWEFGMGLIRWRIRTGDGVPIIRQWIIRSDLSILMEWILLTMDTEMMEPGRSPGLRLMLTRAVVTW